MSYVEDVFCECEECLLTGRVCSRMGSPWPRPSSPGKRVQKECYHGGLEKGNHCWKQGTSVWVLRYVMFLVLPQARGLFLT